MARRRRSFVCRECGAQHATWTGRCPACRAWASVEEVAEAGARTSVTGKMTGAAPLSSFDLRRRAIPRP
ncbi:MAG: hypothetical protein AAFN30_19210 [Actinomycetota bacterium]